MNIDDLKVLYQLMPFEPSDDDLDTGGESEMAYQSTILDILHVFPDDYLAALKAARKGEDYNQVFVNRLLEHGIHLDCVAQSQYGIVVEYLGSGFERQDLQEGYEIIPDSLWGAAKEIWEAMNLNHEDDDEVPGHYETGAHNVDVFNDLIVSMLGTEGRRNISDTISPQEDLGWFIAWVFSTTGHPFLDLSSEEMWESGEYPEWDAENLDYTIDLLASQKKIMAKVERGLDLFKRDKEGFLSCLQKGMEKPKKCLTILTSWLNSVATEMELSSGSTATTE